MPSSVPNFLVKTYEIVNVSNSVFDLITDFKLEKFLPIGHGK